MGGWFKIVRYVVVVDIRSAGVEEWMTEQQTKTNQAGRLLKKKKKKRDVPTSANPGMRQQP